MKFIKIPIPFLSNAKNYFHKKLTGHKIYHDKIVEFGQEYKAILCRKCGTTVQYDPFEDFCLFECRLCSMY
jgi:hypothetical protein